VTGKLASMERQIGGTEKSRKQLTTLPSSVEEGEPEAAGTVYSNYLFAFLFMVIGGIMVVFTFFF
jgi:hypothetical protein